MKWARFLCGLAFLAPLLLANVLPAQDKADVRQEVIALSAGLASAARSSGPPGLPREPA